jgi:hypothetical protein
MYLGEKQGWTGSWDRAGQDRYLGEKQGWTGTREGSRAEQAAGREAVLVR